MSAPSRSRPVFGPAPPAALPAALSELAVVKRRRLVDETPLLEDDAGGADGNDLNNIRVRPSEILGYDTPETVARIMGEEHSVEVLVNSYMFRLTKFARRHQKLFSDNVMLMDLPFDAVVHPPPMLVILLYPLGRYRLNKDTVPLHKDKNPKFGIPLHSLLQWLAAYRSFNKFKFEGTLDVMLDGSIEDMNALAKRTAPESASVGEADLVRLAGTDAPTQIKAVPALAYRVALQRYFTDIQRLADEENARVDQARTQPDQANAVRNIRTQSLLRLLNANEVLFEKTRRIEMLAFPLAADSLQALFAGCDCTLDAFPFRDALTKQWTIHPTGTDRHLDKLCTRYMASQAQFLSVVDQMNANDIVPDMKTMLNSDMATNWRNRVLKMAKEHATKNNKEREWAQQARRAMASVMSSDTPMKEA